MECRRSDYIGEGFQHWLGMRPMTKEIILTKNQVALIDDDDYDLIAAYKWQTN
jgi:hypothetical protein